MNETNLQAGEIEKRPPVFTPVWVTLAIFLGAAFLLRTQSMVKQAKQNGWEDGVFWGARAVQEGASEVNLLERAYEMKHAAEEKTKQAEAKLKELRNK